MPTSKLQRSDRRSPQKPVRAVRAKSPKAGETTGRAKPRSRRVDTSHIARVVHEAMRAFAKAEGGAGLPPWSRAPKWMKTSTEEGVRFRLANPDAPPSAQHDSWAEEKLAAGWRRGKVKDPTRKTHPLLVPYDKLPLWEKRKDALFAAVVRSLSEPL